MNIHLRVLMRIAKISLLPIIITTIFALMYNYLSVQTVVSVFMASVAVWLFAQLYKWILEEIRKEDAAKS